MSAEFLSATEIASLLNVTDRAVRKRAAREAWPASPRRAKGGGNLYALAKLPSDIQAAYSSKSTPNGAVVAEPPIESVEWVDEPAVPIAVNPTNRRRQKQQKKLDEWLAILAAWDRYLSTHSDRPVVELEYEFAEIYNDSQRRNELGLDAAVFEVVRQTSRTTLTRKKAELKKKPGSESCQSQAAVRETRSSAVTY